MRRAIITAGLGFGDEGKGTIVDYLCRKFNADGVVRYSGGSQCAHMVVLPDGRKHSFAQFGAGTLAGVPTYLASPVIVSPRNIINEANHIASLYPGSTSVENVLSQLSVHPDCLVATFYAREMNRIKETRIGKHGSCGLGIGETRSYWLKYGQDAIVFGDLTSRRTLLRKLELQRQRFLLEIESMVGNNPLGSWADTFEMVQYGIQEEVERFLEVGDRVRCSEDMPNFETAIFEGAQGVLLDEWWGFHPNTTWSTVTPHYALEMTREVRSRMVLGITRAYTTRHGAGPLPTEMNSWPNSHRREKLEAAGDHNEENKWQGKMRWGWLDMPLLRYAANSCGRLDGIAVTWLDQFDAGHVCVSYSEPPSRHPQLNAEGGIDAPSKLDLTERVKFTSALDNVKPVLMAVDRDGLLEEIAKIAPIFCESYSNTHESKRWKGPVFG